MLAPLVTLLPPNVEGNRRAALTLMSPDRTRVAEEVGFEPTKGLHPCRISSPVHSTALPLFLLGDPQVAPLDSARGRAHLSTRRERVPSLSSAP